MMKEFLDEKNDEVGFDPPFLPSSKKKRRKRSQAKRPLLPKRRPKTTERSRSGFERSRSRT